MLKPTNHKLALSVAALLMLSLFAQVLPRQAITIANAAPKTERAPPRATAEPVNEVGLPKPEPAPTVAPAAPNAAVIVATLTDNVTAATKIAPGANINYTATITNNGAASPADDATNLNFSAPLDANTTLVAGSVHASPIAVNDTYNWVGNTQLDTAARALPAVTANDVAVNAPAGTDTFTVTAIAGGATALGGSVTLASPSGAFTYTPPLGRPNIADGASVNDTFTYTITNNADPSLTATGTVTITLTGRVWYLQAGAAGDGRSNTPSSSPAAMSTAADKSSDIFYIFSNGTSLNGPFSVDAGQQLLGQGVNLVVNAITLFNAGAAPTTTNTAGNCVALAGAPGNNTLSGFNIGNCTGGTAITGANVGTLNVSTMSINTNGGGLDLTGVSTPTVSVVLGGLTSTGGAKNVNLVGLNGTITLNSGALSGTTAGASNHAFAVSGGGTAAITYSGSITKSNQGNVVNITGRTGGTITLSGTIDGSSSNGINVSSNSGGTVDFSGGTKTLNTAGNAAVTLATNTGATINFSNGGLNIDTTSGSGFSATGGGTVNVTTGASPNTIDTTTGTAVNVTSTTIGASGLTFRSISAGTAATGPVSGIILNSAGSGNFTVSGNNAADSGGIIQHTGGTPGTDAQAGTGAIDIRGGSGNYSFNFMKVLAPGGDGVFILNSTGTISLVTSTIDHNGATVASSYGIRLQNNSGSGTLTLDGTLVQNKLDGTTAISVAQWDTANINFNVQDSNTGDAFPMKFTGLFGSGAVVGCGDNAGGSGTCNVNVSNAQFVVPAPNGSNDFEMGAQQNSILNFNIHDNTFDMSFGDNTGHGANFFAGMINVNTTGNGRIGSPGNQAIINNNIIKNLGSTGALTGYEPIRIAPDNCVLSGGPACTVSPVTHRLAITNNQIQNTWLNIVISARGRSNLNLNFQNNIVGTLANPVGLGNHKGVLLETQGSSNIFTTITGNTIVGAGTSNANSALALDSGADNLEDPATGTIFATMSGNTIKNTASAGTGGWFRARTINLGSGITAGNICLDYNNNILKNSGDANDASKEFNLSHNSTGTFQRRNGGSNVGTETTTGTITTIAGGCTQPSFAMFKPEGSQQQQFFALLNNAATHESQQNASDSSLAFLTATSFGDQLNDETPTTGSVSTIATIAQVEESFATRPSARAEVELTKEPATTPVAPVVANVTPSSQSYRATLGNIMHHAYSTLSSAAHTVDSIITPTAYAQKDERVSPNSGETVTLNTIATFPATKSITIKYSATVNAPPLARSVSTQGTVSGSNFASVLTDDPEPAGGPQATVTLVDTTMTWNGATSTDWNTITNWTQPAGGTQYAPGVSNPAVNDVVIPNVGAQPNISATDIGVFSLNIANGRTLTITSPRVLTIGGSPGGDLTLDGIISGGNLNLGNGTHVINNAGGTGSLSSTNVATVLSGSTVTLNNNLQAGALAVNTGGGAVMNISNRTLSLNGSGAALAIGAGATFTTTGSTVVFNGTAAQQAAGTAYNNLTINNTIGTNITGVTLTGNATVNGTLTLTSSDLDTGAFTLTQPNTTASAGVSDVVGTVTRSGGPFPLATALTFGNPNNIITFTVGTNRPTTLTVVMAKAAPATYAAAVQRNYTISQTGSNNSTATVRLHYLDTELNGNTPEANLNLRRLRTSDSHWTAPPTTTRDTANNFIETTLLAATDLPTQWTFSTFVPTAANGTISGRIADGNGNPVEGAVINLSGDQTRKTITDANGNYHFNEVGVNGFYTVTPSRVNFNFTPFNRSFNLIGNTADAAFGAISTGDNRNPLDTPEYFVRQQYVDILGREPDEGGFNYWSDQINQCLSIPPGAGSPDECIRSRRVGVAAAFFIEAEFQQTGSFIYDLYSGALGRRPVFTEYSNDRRQVLGGPNLDTEKAAFAQSFVQRPEFVAKYQSNTTAGSFVDALIQNVQQVSGVDLSSQRDALIDHYNTGTDLNQSRSFVLSDVAANSAFNQAQYNPAFVLTEYFGYLQRNPDQGGYDFWLNVINDREVGNYRGMVCAFITSTEYQRRFSSVVSHGNGECGP